MPDLDAAVARQREKLTAYAANQRKDWYRVEAKASGGKRTADVYIYAEIGDSFWGDSVSAGDFVREFAAVDADEITVHLNSPGGNFWDSVAIANALRAHPARVITRVDGLAASGASLVAIAGAEVVVAQGSQMMVHEASGLALGTAAEMEEMKAVLDKISDNMAGQYAAKAGGTVEEWRDIQRAETWYNADEAVEANLADRVDTTVNADDFTAKFDLAVYAHAGRAEAPAPRHPGRQVAALKTPAASVDGQTEDKEQPMSDSLKKALRDRLGETDESKSEEDLLAALDERLAGTTPEAAGSDPEQLSKLASASGAVLVDAGVWAESQRRIDEGVQAAKKLREQERDQVVNAAVQDGRIPPAAVDHWKAAYDANPTGIGDVIAQLKRNTVPVEAMGYADDDGEDDSMGEFAGLFPPSTRNGR